MDRKNGVHHDDRVGKLPLKKLHELPVPRSVARPVRPDIGVQIVRAEGEVDRRRVQRPDHVELFLHAQDRRAELRDHAILRKMSVVGKAQRARIAYDDIILEQGPHVDGAAGQIVKPLLPHGGQLLRPNGLDLRFDFAGIHELQRPYIIHACGGGSRFLHAFPPRAACQKQDDRDQQQQNGKDQDRPAGALSLCHQITSFVVFCHARGKAAAGCHNSITTYTPPQ